MAVVASACRTVAPALLGLLLLLLLVAVRQAAAAAEHRPRPWPPHGPGAGFGQQQATAHGAAAGAAVATRRALRSTSGGSSFAASGKQWQGGWGELGLTLRRHRPHGDQGPMHSGVRAHALQIG